MGRKIGYLRVSTAEQNPDRQIDALKDICDEIHVERLSATSRHRPVYERVVAGLETGDVLVILDLDRAYRSARDALNELDALDRRGIRFHIARLDIDTRTPTGRFLYTLMSGLAEFERLTLSSVPARGLTPPASAAGGWAARPSSALRNWPKSPAAAARGKPSPASPIPSMSPRGP